MRLHALLAAAQSCVCTLIAVAWPLQLEEEHLARIRMFWCGQTIWNAESETFGHPASTQTS